MSTNEVKDTKGAKESLIGQEISGCEILQKTAEGGMGAVYRARHKALNRIVCVKILSPALANDKKAVDLFLSEARAVAELDHPNIVNVYNVGKERGYYFIVMSFIEGQTLSMMLKRQKVLPIGLVLDLFDGILKGLNMAHEKGIIHRDIKPSNILIDQDMRPKIVDFGIAKKVDKEKGSTKTTELAGTAYFIAPEQALGRDLDTRADLYSIGASMYYVLTGQFPYNGKNTIDIIQKHINDPVPNPSKLRKDLPPWLSLAIQKLMSKDPAKRFQTAKETYVYFQKMRAEDQLRLKNGTGGLAIDLGTDTALKLSQDSPIENTDSIKRKRQEEAAKRVTQSSGRTGKPVLLPGLEESPVEKPKPVAAPQPAILPPPPPPQGFVPPDDPFAVQPKVEEPKEFKEAFSVRRWIDFAWLPVLMVFSLGISYVFFLFGKICSVHTSPTLGFIANLLAPVTGSENAPHQLVLAGICMVVFLLVFASASIRAFSRNTMGLIIIAGVSYMAGLFTPQVPYWDLTGITRYIFSPEYNLCYLVVAAMWAMSICWQAKRTWVQSFLGTALIALSMVLVYAATGLEIPANPDGLFTKWLLLAGLGCALGAVACLFSKRDGQSSIIAPTLLLLAGIACVWIYNVSGLANRMNTTLDVLASKIDAGIKHSNGPDVSQEVIGGYVSMFQNDSLVKLGSTREINNMTPEDKYKYLNQQISIYSKDAVPEHYRPLMIEMLSAYYTSGESKMNILAWDYSVGYPIQNFNNNAQDNNAYYFLLTILYWFGIIGCACNIVFREEL